VNVLDIGDSELSPDPFIEDDDGLDTEARNDEKFNDTQLENGVKTLHPIDGKDLDPTETTMQADNSHIPDISRTNDNRLKTHSKYEPNFP